MTLFHFFLHQLSLHGTNLCNAANLSSPNINILTCIRLSPFLFSSSQVSNPRYNKIIQLSLSLLLECNFKCNFEDSISALRSCGSNTETVIQFFLLFPVSLNEMQQFKWLLQLTLIMSFESMRSN